MIGLQKGIVKLYPYASEWQELFQEEKRQLKVCAGNYVLDIQHIGSTSIPGMTAKPIIDIGVAVSDYEEAKICIEPIVQLGYEYKGEYGIPKRHYFVKGDPRTHHLHMVEIKSDDWKMNIEFRDYLIQHREASKEYSSLKMKLAEEFAANRQAYQDAKGLFIKKVLTMIKANNRA